MKNYDAYVGIDFGTSGTTFSYWLPKTNLEQGNISVKKWAGIGTANKMETEIILDKNFDKVLAFGKKECSNYPALQLINGKNHFNKANDDKSKFYLKKVIRKVLYSDKIDSKNKEEIKNAYSNYLPNGSYVNES